jgi:acyl carrier protein
MVMNVTTDNIEDRVKRVILKRLKLNLRVENMTLDTPLIGKGLGLDSMGILELVVGLEEEFKIFFDDSELTIELFENIGNLTSHIIEKLNQK